MRSRLLALTGLVCTLYTFFFTTFFRANQSRILLLQQSYSNGQWVHLSRPSLSKMVDTGAVSKICRGSPSGLENIADVQMCLSYLSRYEKEIFVDRNYMPVPTSPKSNEATHTPREDSESLPPEIPRLLYHTYWSGPLTWRVEVFIKSYLFTQNLAHSQLWLWLDEDTDPQALLRWNASKTAERLQPLIDSNHLVIKTWRVPQRVRLPADINHTDGIGFTAKKGMAAYPDVDVIADGVVREPSGEVFVLFHTSYTQAALSPVVRSDIHRFVSLHLHGGIYVDMDVLLLRDLRPLWHPSIGFAERWSVYTGPGDINTAVLSLPAMSEMSSYFLRTGMRLGLNFHPRVLGNIAHKDARLKAVHVFESAFFDPGWPEQQKKRIGPCTVPCLDSFEEFFKARTEKVRTADETTGNASAPGKDSKQRVLLERNRRPVDVLKGFYHGAYAYHIHNQWKTNPEADSWAEIFKASYDEFFAGMAVNIYNEVWEGPRLDSF